MFKKIKRTPNFSPRSNVDTMETALELSTPFSIVSPRPSATMSKRSFIRAKPSMDISPSSTRERRTLSLSQAVSFDEEKYPRHKIAQFIPKSPRPPSSKPIFQALSTAGAKISTAPHSTSLAVHFLSSLKISQLNLSSFLSQKPKKSIFRLSEANLKKPENSDKHEILYMQDSEDKEREKKRIEDYKNARKWVVDYWVKVEGAESPHGKVARQVRIKKSKVTQEWDKKDREMTQKVKKMIADTKRERVRLGISQIAKGLRNLTKREGLRNEKYRKAILRAILEDDYKLAEALVEKYPKIVHLRDKVTFLCYINRLLEHLYI